MEIIPKIFREFLTFRTTNLKVEGFDIFARNFTTQLTFFDQTCLERGKRPDLLHQEIGDPLWPHREVCPQISNSLQPLINFLNALKPRKKNR